MKLTGSIEIAAPRQAVWDAIVDPVSLAGCLPGVRDVRQVDPRTFEGSITASVGPMNGDFWFTAVLAETTPPDALRVRVEGTDSVTKSRLEMDVDATLGEPAPGSTTLDYRASVAVKGRLAILGEMVLRATANLMIGQVTRCLRSRLEASAAADPVAEALER